MNGGTRGRQTKERNGTMENLSGRTHRLDDDNTATEQEAAELLAWLAGEILDGKEPT